jgi:hypothetical protein
MPRTNRQKANEDGIVIEHGAWNGGIDGEESTEAQIVNKEPETLETVVEETIEAYPIPQEILTKQEVLDEVSDLVEGYLANMSNEKNQNKEQAVQTDVVVENKEIVIKSLSGSGRLLIDMTGFWKVKEINSIPYQLIKAYKRARLQYQKQAQEAKNELVQTIIVKEE